MTAAEQSARRVLARIGLTPESVRQRYGTTPTSASATEATAPIPRQSRAKPKPAPFTGTPQKRAEHAVALAKTGKFSLCAIAKACGYHPSSTVAIRELIHGRGRLIDAARIGQQTGSLGFAEGLNRAAMRIVRDFYGMPNINGESSGVQELRDRLEGFPRPVIEQIAELAGLHRESLFPFLRGRHGMKAVTQKRVWDAIAEMGGGS